MREQPREAIRFYFDVERFVLTSRRDFLAVVVVEAVVGGELSVDVF
jgi:hypothetical protein